MSCESIRAVHPATYVSQPPLTKLGVWYDTWGDSDVLSDRFIQRAGGVTFGDVLEVIDTLRIYCLQSVGMDHSAIISQEEKCMLTAVGVAATDHSAVIRARKNFAEGLFSIGAKGPDANNDGW